LDITPDFWTAGRGTGTSSSPTFEWRVQYSDNTVIKLPMTYDDPWDTNRPQHAGQQWCLDIKLVSVSWFRSEYRWSDEECASKYCAVCEIDP